MTNANKTIVKAIGEVLLLALLILLVPICLAIDVLLLDNSIGEISLTEITQLALLATSILIFGYSAWQSAGSRGFLILVTGFFSCMLVRELDFLFDKIRHGFWFWPAIVIVIASIFFALKNRRTLFEPMAAFVNTKPYFHIIFGLLVVLFFSRIFGSGNLFWQHVISDYSRVYKSILQEGLELFGYLFAAYGSCQLIRYREISDNTGSSN